MDNNLRFELHSNVLSKLKNIDQYVQFSKADGTLRKEDLRVKEAASNALEEFKLLVKLLDNPRIPTPLSQRSMVHLSESLGKTTEKLQEAAREHGCMAEEGKNSL